MPLCSLCRSIPWEDLPAFPEKTYSKTSTGLQYVHTMFANADLDPENSTSRAKYHGSLEELRLAAAGGCDFCQLVNEQADCLLAEIDSLDDVQRMTEGSPPKFDMWLTKRPEGGDGLWVLSECDAISEDEPGPTLPIAAVVFGASENDPLASQFRGRPIKPSPDDEVFALVQRWLVDCDANHHCCSSIAPLPATVIDVSSPESKGYVSVVRLGEGAEGHYAALSYSHEGNIESGYTSATTAQYDATSPALTTTTLPQIFQDAICVTRRLGIQYLWIDAICIPADERIKVERHSPAFASIYTNATLTLAATGCLVGSGQGLFHRRPARHSFVTPYSTSQGTRGNLWMQALPLDKEILRRPYLEMSTEPLWKGVWSFQERVLSPRVLHFASDQLYFECMKHFLSEDGLLMDERYHSAHNLQKETALSQWNDLLWSYGPIVSENASDKLPALANIARFYQAVLQDEYIAGCWKASLVESLCWQPVQCSPVNFDRAPHWSWASVDGIVGMGFHTPTWESFTTIRNVDLQLDGLDPFGKIKTGYVNLQAPMVSLGLADPDDTEGHICLRTEQGSKDGFYARFDTIPMAYATSAEAVRRLQLFALVLAETQILDCDATECGNSPSYHGIIVVPVDGKSGHMKRVGFFLADPDDLALGDVSLHNTIVTLV